MTTQLDGMNEDSMQLTAENYKKKLEDEIVRRIEIMEEPEYQRVPSLNGYDHFWAVAGIIISLALVIWGGTF